MSVPASFGIWALGLGRGWLRRASTTY